MAARPSSVSPVAIIDPEQEAHLPAAIPVPAPCLLARQARPASLLHTTSLATWLTVLQPQTPRDWSRCWQQCRAARSALRCRCAICWPTRRSPTPKRPHACQNVLTADMAATPADTKGLEPVLAAVQGSQECLTLPLCHLLANLSQSLPYRAQLARAQGFADFLATAARGDVPLHKALLALLYKLTGESACIRCQLVPELLLHGACLTGCGHVKSQAECSEAGDC